MTDLIYSALPKPKRAIVFVNPTLSIKACVSIMARQNIGALLVRAEDDVEDNRVLGIMTERDVIRECVHRGLDPNRTSAADIAYKNISVLKPNDPLEKAMETITETKRRYVLIKEEDEPIAILSIGDLLYHLLEDKSRVIEHLQNYIHS